ncbi:MAG: hypothetical protein K0S76_2606 [Herbinix sp.]|jgi:spore germination protein|nr:hypothetical protein [Herbinix sp.]
MIIHVVQSQDTIYSIAEEYGVTVNKLIQDNGLENPYSLVVGQTLVILFPVQTHTVREGDALSGLANTYDISHLKLLQNNSFLSDRECLYPGETIVIRYNKKGTIVSNGYAYPYIKKNTLIKTLPYLTYLSVFNYRVSGEGDVSAYYDDSEIIPLAIQYGVIPLMMLSAVSLQGEPNMEVIFNVLLSDEYQDRIIDKILVILKTKNYYGVNVIFSSINEINDHLYINYLRNISNRLQREGYLLFVTINPNMKYVDNQITFDGIDYTRISRLVNGITFLQYVWGTNSAPPQPVSSINFLRTFIDYVVHAAPPELIALGSPLISYDWELPYMPEKNIAHALTLQSAIALANDVGAEIHFDDASRTPYFQYGRYTFGSPVEHMVWSIDARSMDALNDLVAEYNLGGTGIWNIMIYSQQLWSIINSQYEIIKIISDNLP